jgi:hypothetical protein
MLVVSFRSCDISLMYVEAVAVFIMNIINKRMQHDVKKMSNLWRQA